MSNSESSKEKNETGENEAGSSGQTESVNEVKSSESRGQVNKIDESDEDIPGDFFDDFLKEDFMAGLDIVDDDEWDENKIKIDLETSEKSKNDTPSAKQQTESVKKRKKDKVSGKNADSSTKKKSSEERRSRQKKRRNEDKRDEPKHKKTSEKQIDADEFDIRRDPEKTKRDIARDKVRCEKDKEMKIISEKLSLVETGLVPPGMEMEIDIEELKKQKEKIGNKSPRDLREHLKDLKGRNRSPVHKPRSPLRRRSPRRSPLLLKKLSPLRRRSRSPRKDSVTLVRSALSPIRRSPRRSPLRRLSPRRISPLRHRSSERAYIRRRSRSLSPYYRNRRHRERSGSRESDRERWLKRRNRSRSPRRKRDEKKSFLQEIAEKLNEIRHPVNMMPQLQPMPPVQPILQPMQPILRYVEPQSLPVPVPAPAPVPPPPNSAPAFPNPQQQQKYDPYDQSFFIGDPQAPALNSFPGQPQPSPVPGGPQIIPSPVQPRNTSFVMPNSVTPNSMNVSTPNTMTTPSNVEHLLQNNPRLKLENQEDVTKLFQDKQISLSEFLAITAKPEVFSSSPTHLQEKIKVITRCHDAIKILENGERKYSGRLVVQKTNKYKVNTGKYLSPLKSLPQVQFAFTNPVISEEEQKNTFTNFVNDLLQKLGLLKDTVVNVDDEEPEVPTRNVVSNFSPPPPPLITPIKNPVPRDVKPVRYNNFVETNRLSKMVQTDVFKCENCEKRKKILYRHASMQTTNPPVTFSVSTQVTEEEFQPRIPKTQSLAALTPAQLLAKSRESLNAATRGARLDTDTFDIHSTSYNRPNFFRGPDNYGLSRPNPPFVNPSAMYDGPDSLYEGGGRGREPYASRTLDPNNVRFSHSYY